MNLKGQRLLVCGGAGFIGSAFCRVAKSAGYQVTVYDALTYAGDALSLSGLSCPLIRADLTDCKSLASFAANSDAIVNFAASSHVTRSITGSMDPFISANVTGVQALIDVARKFSLPLIQISSDEVYGPVESGFVDEQAPLRPANGYSATKAAGDLLIKAACNSYKIEAAITRCVNNYGPRQNPEKLVARTIACALTNRPIPVHGQGQHVRDWIWVYDHARAVMLVLQKGESGQVYNVAAHRERSSIEIVREILQVLNKSTDLIQLVDDRPGNDIRYGITNDKITALGWAPEKPWLRLDETVDWYRSHESWWKHKLQ